MKILSMANSWRSIRSQLEGHLYCMFEHLVKVYYYHNYSEYMTGWITSIRKGFEHIEKLSNTNNYPTKEQLFQFIWNEWLDGEIDSLQDNIIGEINHIYTDVPKIEEINYLGFKDFAMNYCKLLSEKVSSKGYISTSEIEEYVSSYFNLV